MCLGVPGKVIEWIERDTVFSRAIVEFSGVTRECQMACVPEVQVGDYVIVHAGVAICRLDENAAKQSLADWQSINQWDVGGGPG